MYKLTIESKLGDYLVYELDDKIYEITGISINLMLNEETLEEELKVVFEGVDVMYPESDYFILDGRMVHPATNDEVNEYLGFEEIDIFDENEGFFFDTNKEEEKMLDSFFQKINEYQKEKNIKEKSHNINQKDNSKLDKINKILDEYLDYNNMIEQLGDPDGSYAKHVMFLKKEFKRESTVSV